MKRLIRLLVLAAALTFTHQVQAHEGFELGLGAGTSNALTPDSFKSDTTTGDAQLYWISYGLDKNWAAEISHESFDFDRLDSKYKNYTLSAAYTFLPTSQIHPLAKLGVGFSEVQSVFDVKATSAQAKASFGLESDFKFISVGALFNYIYMTRANINPGYENSSALIPALYITFHESREYLKVSQASAPALSPQTKLVISDSDADGVSDNDDKCPQTPAGIAVNGYGCALTEKASVKLQVEFSKGKSDLDAKYDSEISRLSKFMSQYPETQVEIAGYTDNTGSAAQNISLSQKRAEAVKTALIKAGVDKKRVTARGYGAKNPLADNSTEIGRQANRRVMADISVQTEKKK